MKKIITFSFDDGCIYDFKIAELIKKYGFNATYYISTSHSHAPLNKNQIKDLSYLGEIGAHTQNHLSLELLSKEKQYSEIYLNKEYLEDITGSRIKMFCPPKGKFNKMTIDIVKKLGFKGMRTTRDFSISGYKDKYNIKTTLQLYPHTSKVLTYHLLKGLNSQNINMLSRTLNINIDNVLEYYINKLLKSGGILHLWGHSWEIEKINYWTKFEDMLKNLSAYKFSNYSNGDLV